MPSGAFADLLVRIRGDASELIKSLSGTSRDFKAWGDNLTNIGKSATLGLSLPLLAGAGAAIKLSGDLEQTTIAFETLLGSASAAQRQLTDLREFAKRTPFEFTELTDASKRLLAFGFSAKELIPTLTSVGNASAALGLGAEGIDRITRALGQIRAKGKAQSEELLQLAEAGIPAFELLAKTLNTTVAGAMDQVKKGAVDASTAVTAILGGINERFGGLMERQSKTLLGTLSNLKDSAVEIFTGIGQELQPTAQRLVGFLQELEPQIRGILERFRGLDQGTKDFAVSVGVAAVALPPLIYGIGTLLTSFGKITGAVSGIIKLLGPTGWGAATIAARGGIYAFIAALTFPELKRLAEELGKAILAFDNLGRSAEKAEDPIGRFVTNSSAYLKEFRALVDTAIGGAADQVKRFVDYLSGAAPVVDRLRGMVDPLGTPGQQQAATRGGGFQLGAGGNVVPLQGPGGSKTADIKELIGNVETYAQITARLNREQAGLNQTKGDGEKVTRLATLAELQEAEIRNRGSAAIAKAVSALVTLRQAHELFGTKLETVSSKIKDNTLSIEVLGSVADSAVDQIAAMTEPSETLRRTMEAMTPAVGDVTEAFSRLGIKTTAQLKQVAETARIAYEAAIAAFLAGSGAIEDVSRASAAWERAKKAVEDYGQETVKTGTKSKRALLEVSTVTTDLGRSLAKLIIEGGKFGEVMKKAAIDIGEALLRRVIEAALTPIIELMSQLIAKTAKWVLGLLEAVPAIGKVISKLGDLLGLGGNLGKTGGNIAGGVGGVVNAGSQAVGGAASAAGSVAGAAASIAGSALTGIVGAVAGVGTLISSVVANFQLAKQETSLNAIELNTRRSGIFLGEQESGGIFGMTKRTAQTIEQLWGWTISTTHELSVKTVSSLESIDDGIRRLNAVGGGGSITTTMNINGGMFTADPVQFKQFVDMIGAELARRSGVKP